MNRRGFLSRFLGGAVAATAATLIAPVETLAETFDPEKLLWTPGAKSFFIPELVKPKNIRVATDAEVAKVTGKHFVRVKQGSDIFVADQEVLIHHAEAMNLWGELHLDDGSVVHLNNRSADRIHLGARIAEAQAETTRRLSQLRSTQRDEVTIAASIMRGIHSRGGVFMPSRPAPTPVYREPQPPTLAMRKYNEWAKRQTPKDIRERQQARDDFFRRS